MVDLFQDLSQKQKERLLKTLQAFTVKFNKGINIISYMNRQNTIGIVQSGSLKITVENYDGNVSLIDELNKNDIFGSMISTVILDDDCVIITQEETILTFIDYENITNTEILKNDFYITFIHNFLRVITEQISIKNERIQILTKKNIREKLLTYFTIIQKKQGTKVLTLPITLSTLSSYIAVDRSAMMREIRNLNDEGIIDSKGKRIVLNF